MTSSDSSSSGDTKMLNFKPQKTIAYNKLLPYYEEISEEAVPQLKLIKENLSKAVILRDIRPGAIHWVGSLSRYIKLYGLYFSKEDHILFIKLLYELVINPDQEFWITSKFCQILSILLKKRELLSPDDVTLPWKPLAEIYHKIFYSSYKTLGMMQISHNSEVIFKNVVRSCRPYFPREATAEIMEKAMPQFCPYDSQLYKASTFLELFLPAMIPPSGADYGYKLWLDELLGFWSTFHNEPMSGASMFSLFARLAWHNIGHIDWEQHIPLIFTRIINHFHLPVLYKKVAPHRGRGLEMWALSMFIVANLGGGSRTQKELERLFKILESYFHPSNSGYWTRPLHDFQLTLTQYFVQRLHNERFRKPSWFINIAEDKKLTEDDITAFVKCLQPSANLSVFSKSGSYEAGVVLHRLALLRPEIIIPPLLDQLYSAMDTMTEPHRLIASLHCIVGVARPLVMGGKKSPTFEITYPEGLPHVLPLLFQTLPGIDPNDVNKCMVTFQFISTLVSLVPLVDCSSASDVIEDMSEVEQVLCSQTAQFENFVLEFLSRSFTLVESLALEQSASIEREKDTMNLEENMVEIGLSSTFKTILTQSHPKIFDAALERLLSFTRGRCLEVKVGGKFVATMWRSASKVNPDKTLNAFLPCVCRLIHSLTECPDTVTEENIDEELLFNLLLLSELVQSKGLILVQFVPKIAEVLERTLHLKNRKGYRMASSILRNLLWTLNLTVAAEVRSAIHTWDTPFEEYFPIRHWGEPGNIDNLNLKWNEPGEEEEKAIVYLIRKFLTPELTVIKQFIDGDSSVTRDRLHQCLCIIQDILYAGASLSLWDEQPINLVQMEVPRDSIDIKLRSRLLKITLDSDQFPENVRLAVANTIIDLVDQLLKNESDDTKSLNYASSIFMNVCFFHGVKRDEFETRWKSFERVKQSFSDSVVKKKQHIRALLIERVVLQYEMRILESASNAFTLTHKRILDSLLRLSMSYYSDVRIKSQGVINQFFRRFPYSYKLVLPTLTNMLKKDPEENYKQLKGALYVILGFREKALVVRRDWGALEELLPTLVATPHTEKLSVIRLFDAILRAFCRFFEYFAIELKVSDSVVTVAYDLLKSSKPDVFNSAIEEGIGEKRIEVLKQKSSQNLSKYLGLVHKLSDLIKSGSLHWRRTQVAVSFLGSLIRPDEAFPACGVRAVVSLLLHDNIVLRKTAVNFLPSILKNQKRAHKKITIDPRTFGGVKSSSKEPGDNREDNKWLQYDRNSLELSEEEWDNKIFVHKTWIGWYSWPKTEIEVYAPAIDQPNIDRAFEDLVDAEKVIYQFFTSDDSVQRLVSFLSLEENKGRDKFEQRKFRMFKGLFRNFGDVFLPVFQPHLERLVSESQESSQRCAAEIIAGMVRGSKHWRHQASMKVLNLSRDLLRVVFNKVMNESKGDWAACLSCISMDRDPNRLAPLMELLLEDMVPQGEASFIISSRLYLSQVFLEQQEWRISESYHRLQESLEPHLSNPYKSIRDRIGWFLYRMYMRDEARQMCTRTLSPHLSDFVEAILPQLTCLILESSSGSLYSPMDASSHPPPMGSESPVMPMLPIKSIGRSLFREPIPASRPESPKESQGSTDSPPRESSDMSDPIDINKASLCSSSSLPAPDAFGTPNNLYDRPADTEERKIAIRLMNTICKHLTCVAIYTTTPFPAELYKFLPHLCHMESVDTDLELRNNCINALGCIARLVVAPSDIYVPLHLLKSICLGGWWRSRIAGLSFLQVFIFNNMFSVLESGFADVVKQMVLDSLQDSRAEVRQMASQVLSGLFHSNFLPADKKLLDGFTKMLNKSKRVREKSTGRLLALDASVITERHCGSLGLGAFISAYPYDVPAYMPEALITLSEHINDPQPISTDVKQTLSHFRRTHHDNWQDHKKHFSSEQLSILTEVLVSPSYYA